MGFAKDDKDKKFVCRQCNTFLDAEELVNGCCPNCKNDEDVFINENDE
jgi:Zn finger protein HypA/HybF involved in hydrogenase expression